MTYKGPDFEFQNFLRDSPFAKECFEGHLHDKRKWVGQSWQIKHPAKLLMELLARLRRVLWARFLNLAISSHLLLLDEERVLALVDPLSLVVLLHPVLLSTRHLLVLSTWLHGIWPSKELLSKFGIHLRGTASSNPQLLWLIKYLMEV